MAAVSVTPASSPNAATPRASRKACRRRSRSSCTSIARRSSRFSPIVNSRPANRLEFAASCLRLPVTAVSILWPVAVAGTPAREEITNERPDPDPDGDGLVGMLMHRLVGRFGAFDCFVADTARDFLGAFQRDGETFAGFADFFSRHVGGGGHQRACVFGQLSHVMAGCFRFFVHIFFFSWFVSFF